ncbi:MAG: ammonia channel protein [Acidobacteria bacterium]|nr:MAG: ammonia channel protein [Acidobacteriota bacterium]
MNRAKHIVLLLLVFLSVGVSAFAQAGTPAPEIDTGDTAWMLTSAALVLFMTIPGLFLFYGGLVRSKNVLGMLMQNFIMVGIITIQWIVIGYSLAFANGTSFLGGLQWAGLSGVGLTPNADYAATIPHQTFMFYQLMFAIITPALMTGAFAERMKFSTFMVFSLLWATFIYDPLAHWVWGVGGFLRNMGALDFAGGTVVHISAGISALVAVLIMGKRVGFGKVPMAPHNLPFAVIGAAMLWVGWFGFNAGSALGANGLASSAFMATHTAASLAALGWMTAEWIKSGKPTMLGAASGAVAGLVAITPASGFVTPLAAIVIGFGAGVICYSACMLKSKFGYDDSLDVVGVHGVGGIFGALMTGVFATKAINPAGNDGLLYGNPSLFVTQLIAVAVTVVFVAAGSAVILLALKAIMGLRVTEQEERMGLDLSQHSESAYVLASDYDEVVSSHSSGHIPSGAKIQSQKA